MESEPDPDLVVIEGITEEGQRFRPSDWAERLASLAAEFDSGRRLRFSPQLRPVQLPQSKALQLNRSLAETAPELWDTVMNFAETNHLRITAPLIEYPQLKLAS